MFIGKEEVEFTYNSTGDIITVIYKDLIIGDEYSYYDVHKGLHQTNYKYVYALKGIKDFMENNWPVCYTDFYGYE